MKLYIKYDGIVACRVILQEQLERLNIKYTPVTRAWWNRNKWWCTCRCFCRITVFLGTLFYCKQRKKSADSKNKGYDCRNDLWKREITFSYDITIFIW
jgi:hypothetical protein